MPAITGSETPIVVGPREQLFHLLAEAAEIEHTLMCSYLYAAFSLKSGSGTNLTESEAAAVGRWREAILGVAIDEMSHLLLVANLSIAIGGRPHFARPNFPVASGYFPSGVVVKLAPFSVETLQHLIFLERPRGVRHADGDGFEPEEDYQREEAFHGLMPSVQDYGTVGRLYDALRANLVASSQRLGESSLFIGPVAAQVGREAVDLQGVATVCDLKSAIQAIDTIVEQGEGSSQDREDSHYHRFLMIRKEYRELLSRNPAFAPAWNVAESPVMRRPPEPQGKIFVDHPAAARVLDFGNALYAVTLRCLVQAFGRQGEHAGRIQGRYLAAALSLMHQLARVAAALVRMPASPEHSGVMAGLTFTMLRSVEPFLSGSSERHLMQERLREIREGAALAVQMAPQLAGIEAALDEILERLS